MSQLMDKKVDIFLIGARKAATTTIAAVMDEHTELSVCEGKEPEFFNRIDISQQDIDEYHKLYNQQSKHWIDASTVYSVNDTSQAIYNYNPNAKIIYSLRHPLKRIVSHYKMAKERRFYNGTLQQSVYDHQAIISSCKYYDHAREYIQKFGREHVLIVDQTKLMSDPRVFFNEIAGFLDIGEFVQVEKNENNAASIKRLPHTWDIVLSSTWYKFLHKYILPSKLTASIRYWLHNRMNESLDLEIDEKTIIYLSELINPQLDQLASLIDFDIDDWYIKT